MDLIAILIIIFLYIIAALLTWQFWIVVIIETYKSDDPDYDKLLDIPLLYFLIFWPVSLVMMIALLIHKKKKY